MAPRRPATVTRPVRALGTAVHDLTPERHEPDKSRGLRPDLWGPGGEIPPGYPARRVANRRPPLPRRGHHGPAHHTPRDATQLLASRQLRTRLATGQGGWRQGGW